MADQQLGPVEGEDTAGDEYTDPAYPDRPEPGPDDV